MSSSETTSSAANDTASSGGDPLGLTPELRRLTDAFANIGDDKLRYKQLLYMASNGLDKMPDELKTDDNKVLGCLSTVHVHATLDDKNLVSFTGDSDGLLTKGLVALLVRYVLFNGRFICLFIENMLVSTVYLTVIFSNSKYICPCAFVSFSIMIINAIAIINFLFYSGLSGNTAEAIQTVDPKFIQKAGISQSLTPGRNNGFLNMLALMKQKAKEATSSTSEASSSEDADEESDDTAFGDSDRPMYNGMMAKLQQLKPTLLELKDNSHEHAGHAGNTGNGTESHFQLTIVADAFDGLNLVKRHQLIYMMLGDIMPKIHALQIQALTPAEADKAK